MIRYDLLKFYLSEKNVKASSGDANWKNCHPSCVNYDAAYNIYGCTPFVLNFHFYAFRLSSVKYTPKTIKLLSHLNTLYNNSSSLES